MNFLSAKKFIENKIKELKLPYFKILVKQNGKEVFSYRYSKYDDNNDLLTMYSMTKVITSTAFMKLVEDGLVSPEDHVSKYLKGFDNLKLLSGEKVKTEMKIKHLLTMTGGLDYDYQRPSLVKLLEDNPNANCFDVCEAFVKDGLLFEPGSKFNYSLCMDVVGGIIEKVSGMRFCEYVDKLIFKPFEMKNTTLDANLELIKKALPDEAFINGEMKQIKKSTHLVYLTKNYSSGGSSVISTVDDYSKFLDALLSEKIITKESINTMSFPYLKETPFCADVQKYSSASFDYGYGYGVRVRQIASSHGMPIGEFGWDGASGSYCLIDKVNNISIVMGMNVMGWPTHIKDFHVKLVELIYDGLN